MDLTMIITTALTAILSSGSVAGIFYFKENKRAKQLQNEITAASQWRELYEKSEKKVDSQGVKIEKLYKENGQLRDERDDLSTEVATLKIYKCETIKCEKRVPPLGTQNKNNTQQ